MTENRYLKGIMACLLLFSMLILAKLYTDAEKSRATIKESDFLVSENVLSGNEVSQNRLPGTGGCIVIDPGHGGVDGGKIGVNGALEKDINLQMAFLQQMLKMLPHREYLFCALGLLLEQMLHPSYVRLV